MILSYREDEFIVPHTSKCIIHTKGILHDGDVITVTSPVFASTIFTSKAINMSDRFDVKLKLVTLTEVNNADDVLYGTLVCDDNDIFNMYVKI